MFYFRIYGRFLFEKLQAVHQEIKEIPKKKEEAFLSESEELGDVEEIIDEQAEIDVYTPAIKKRKSKTSNATPLGQSAPSPSSQAGSR